MPENFGKKKCCDKYFGLNRDNMPGTARFYSDEKSKCPDSVRFKRQDKFPKMVMVWVAISPRGISKSPSIESPIYIDKCLEKSLLPFIRSFKSIR